MERKYAGSRLQQEKQAQKMQAQSTESVYGKQGTGRSGPVGRLLVMQDEQGVTLFSLNWRSTAKEEPLEQAKP